MTGGHRGFEDSAVEAHLAQPIADAFYGFLHATRIYKSMRTVELIDYPLGSFFEHDAKPAARFHVIHEAVQKLASFTLFNCHLTEASVHGLAAVQMESFATDWTFVSPTTPHLSASTVEAVALALLSMKMLRRVHFSLGCTRTLADDSGHVARALATTIKAGTLRDLNFGGLAHETWLEVAHALGEHSPKSLILHMFERRSVIALLHGARKSRNLHGVTLSSDSTFQWNLSEQLRESSGDAASLQHVGQDIHAIIALNPRLECFALPDRDDMDEDGAFLERQVLLARIMWGAPSSQDPLDVGRIGCLVKAFLGQQRIPKQWRF